MSSCFLLNNIWLLYLLQVLVVKNFMKSGNIEGKVETDLYGRSYAPLRMSPSKPITPDEREVEQNPRSRSAKLRIAIKQ